MHSRCISFVIGDDNINSASITIIRKWWKGSFVEVGIDFNDESIADSTWTALGVAVVHAETAANRAECIHTIGVVVNDESDAISNSLVLSRDNFILEEGLKGEIVSVAKY